MTPDSADPAFFDDRVLAREFNYLAKLIFCVEPKTEMAESYCRANAIVFQGANTDRIQELMTEAMDRKCDLEAVETASRMKDKSNFLTQKIQIIFYLMETQPEYFHLFVNRESSVFIAYLLLSLHTLRSMYKLIKGTLLLKTPPCREFVRRETHP